MVARWACGGPAAPSASPPEPAPPHRPSWGPPAAPGPAHPSGPAPRTGTATPTRPEPPLPPAPGTPWRRAHVAREAAPAQGSRMFAGKFKQSPRWGSGCPLRPRTQRRRPQATGARGRDPGAGCGSSATPRSPGPAAARVRARLGRSAARTRRVGAPRRPQRPPSLFTQPGRDGLSSEPTGGLGRLWPRLGAGASAEPTPRKGE